MRSLVLVLVLALPACGGASLSSAVPRAAVSREWWPRLREGLAGDWATTTESGRTLEVRYHSVSGGSALVQEWAPATAGETLTVFHPDGDALLLTHYCGQGNQAHLAAVDVCEDCIVFRRVELTNESSDQSALYELTLRLAADGQTYEQTETYTNAGGEAETTVLVFHRTPA